MSWKKTKDHRIKKRGDWYWARFQKDGILVEETLGTKSYSIAVKLADNIEACIKLGDDWKKSVELFEDAWPKFLDDKLKGIKTKQGRPSTIQEYKRMGENLYLPFFGAKTLDEVNSEDAWEEFLISVSENTEITDYLNVTKYMGGFLSWAFKKGKIKSKVELRNPSKKAKDSDEVSGPGKEYTEAELSAMLENSHGPFHLYLAMGILMGMRSSERTQLMKDRIDKNISIIKLRAIDTKIGKGRSVPIHPYIRPLLIAQMEAHKASPCVFPNRKDISRPMDPGGFKKPWGALRGALGIKGRGHDFKHSFITRCLREGMNPVILAEIVGTSIKVIQEKYLHLTDSDFRQAIKEVSKP